MNTRQRYDVNYTLPGMKIFFNYKQLFQSLPWGCSFPVAYKDQLLHDSTEIKKKNHFFSDIIEWKQLIFKTLYFQTHIAV